MKISKFGFVFIFIFSLLASHVNSQITLLKEGAVQDLESRTLCVVLHDNIFEAGNVIDQYNEDLQKFIPEHWHYSKFEFIKESQLWERFRDDQYMFLKLYKSSQSQEINTNIVKRDIDVIKHSVLYFHFFLGAKTNGDIAYFENRGAMRFWKKEKEALYMPLRALGEYDLYAHEMPLNIEMLQQYLAQIKDGKVFTKKHQGMAKSPLVEMLHEDVDLSTKILVFDKAFIENKITEEFIAEAYPYPFEIMTADEISKLIETKAEKYCILKVSRNEFSNLFALVQTSDFKTIRYNSVYDFWHAYDGDLLINKVLLGDVEANFRKLFDGLVN